MSKDNVQTYAKEMAKEGRQALTEIIENCLDGMLEMKRSQAPYPMLYAIKAPAGAGKTTAVQNWVLKQKSACVIFMFVPTQAKAEEIRIECLEAGLGEFAEVKVIKGRSAKIDESNSGLGEMCARYKIAKQLALSEQSARNTLCISKTKEGVETYCPHYATCPYIQQFRGLKEVVNEKSLLIVMPHNYLTIAIEDLPEPDIVIIDESCIDALRLGAFFYLDVVGKIWLQDAHFQASWKRIESSLQYASQLPFDFLAFPKTAFKDPSFKACLNKVIQSLSMHISLGKAYALQGSDEERIERFDLDNLPKLVKARNILQELYEYLETRKIYPNRFSVRVPDKRVSGTLAMYFHGLKELQNIPANVGILMIDATLDKRIVKRLFPQRADYLEVIELEIEPNWHLTLINDHSYSNDMLKGTSKYAENREFSKKLNSQLKAWFRPILEPTLVVGIKAWIKSFRNEIDNSHLAYENFGGLRGINKYKDIHQCIVIGRELFPAGEVLEVWAADLYALDPTPIQHLQGRLAQERRTIKMRDGREKQVLVDVHPDPRVQWVNEQRREAEIVQAMARIRPIGAKVKKHVLIFCKLALPFTIDRVCGFEELLAGGTLAEQAIQRFLTVGPAVPLDKRAWIKTDIWETESAAKGYLDRTFPSTDWDKWCGFHMKNYMGTEPLWNIEYRNRGGRGRPSRALVGGPMETIQITLEKVLGHPITIISISEWNHSTTP